MEERRINELNAQLTAFLALLRNYRHDVNKGNESTNVLLAESIETMGDLMAELEHIHGTGESISINDNLFKFGFFITCRVCCIQIPLSKRDYVNHLTSSTHTDAVLKSKSVENRANVDEVQNVTQNDREISNGEINGLTNAVGGISIANNFEEENGNEPNAIQLEHRPFAFQREEGKVMTSANVALPNIDLFAQNFDESTIQKALSVKSNEPPTKSINSPKPNEMISNKTPSVTPRSIESESIASTSNSVPMEPIKETNLLDYPPIVVDHAISNKNIVGDWAKLKPSIAYNYSQIKADYKKYQDETIAKFRQQCGVRPKLSNDNRHSREDVRSVCSNVSAKIEQKLVQANTFKWNSTQVNNKTTSSRPATPAEPPKTVENPALSMPNSSAAAVIAPTSSIISNSQKVNAEPSTASMSNNNQDSESNTQMMAKFREMFNAIQSQSRSKEVLNQDLHRASSISSLPAIPSTASMKINPANNISNTSSTKNLNESQNTVSAEPPKELKAFFNRDLKLDHQIKKALILKNVAWNQKAIDEFEQTMKLIYPNLKCKMIGSRSYLIANDRATNASLDIFVDPGVPLNTDQFVAHCELILSQTNDWKDFEINADDQSVKKFSVLHRPSSIRCEFLVGDNDIEKHSIFVAHFFCIEPKLLELVHCLRMLFREHPKYSIPSVSGYAISLLAIYYFQYQRYVPSVKSLSGQKLKQINVSDLDEYQKQQNGKGCKKKLRDLLIGFFEFYAKFEFNRYVINLYLGDSVKSSMQNDDEVYLKIKHALNIRPKNWTPFALSIQDILNFERNVCRLIPLKDVEQFQICCNESAQILKSFGTKFQHY